MDKRKDYEIEINVKQIMYVILDKLAIIILFGIVCALAAFLYSKFYVTPQYSSKASIYISNKEDSTSVTTYSDTLSASNLAGDFEEMITTRKVLDEVVTDLNLDISVYGLASRVSVKSAESSSRILYITVKDSDPYEAKKIVDKIVEIAQKRSSDMMDIDNIMVWDDGSISTNPVSPNVRRNVMLAFLAAIVVATAIVLIRFATDDTFKHAEDVESKLGISVLGAIPFEADKTKKRSGKVRRKR